MNTAVFPGSFDPVTVGHLDIIARAAAIFDRVIVCIMVTGPQHPLVTLEERRRSPRAARTSIPTAQAVLCDGLLADFARKQGARTLVKGVRGCADFDWEFQMAQINRGLWPELDTVFLPAQTKHLHISSTMAREMIRYRQDLSGCIPAGALEAVLESAEGKDNYGK